MKLAGVIFVLVSAFSVGFGLSSSLKKRCKYLRKFLNTLQVMRSELSSLSTPLPQIFSTVSDSADGEVKEIFLSVASYMEDNRWMTPRTAFERALLLHPDELLGELLLELAEKLGSYDLQSQLAGIDRAETDAQDLLRSMEDEMRMRSKTYQTLSISVGLALVILLI